MNLLWLGNFKKMVSRGSNIDLERRLLWEEVAGILSWWELPSFIEGLQCN